MIVTISVISLFQLGKFCELARDPDWNVRKACAEVKFDLFLCYSLQPCVLLEKIRKLSYQLNNRILAIKSIFCAKPLTVSP